MSKNLAPIGWLPGWAGMAPHGSEALPSQGSAECRPLQKIAENIARTPSFHPVAQPL